VYIDHVIYFNRITIVTNPNEYIVLYVLRALRPDYSIYYLSDINKNLNRTLKRIKRAKAFINTKY
jgi:hypothetical protein